MATTPSSNVRSSTAHLAVWIAALACVISLAWGTTAQAELTRPYTGKSFGPSGTGAGAFSSVEGVAVDQLSGDVFVYDAGAGGRVYRFNAAGEPVDFSALSSNTIEGVGGAGSAEGEIAVDNSSGPDAGDIYIANDSEIRIYSASGTRLGELTGGETCGVAVDPSGVVYVGVYPETVRKYTPVTNPVTDLEETGSMAGLNGVCNVAADSKGNLYAASYPGGITSYEASQFGSLAATGEMLDEHGRTLAVDPMTGNLYANSDSSISEYDSSGVLVSTFTGSELAEGSFGVAVKSAGGEIYAPAATHRIDIFGAVVLLPDVATQETENIDSTTATVAGTVNPDGLAATYQFEYGTDTGYGSVSPLSPASVGSDSSEHSVSASLAGLAPDTVYHYRLVATNTNGVNRSTDRTFRTTGPPVVDGETFSEVGASGARLSAEVNDFGIPGSYHYEYGTSSSYGSETAPVSLAAAEGDTSAQAPIGDLQPGILYHFRMVAEGPHGTGYGVDETFTTFEVGMADLPDGRAYELVTPPNKENANVYIPDYIGEASTTSTALSFQASPDGSRVAYAADPTTGGNGKGGGGQGNQYLATRSASGWTQVNAQPLGDNLASYQVFNEDLTLGFLDSCAKAPISPAAPAGYDDLYEYPVGGSGFVPLVTSTPPNRSKGSFDAAGFSLTSVTCSSVAYGGSSTNGSHALFEANDALTPQAESNPPGSEENDLYDSVNGQLSLVNVLPSGAVDPNATFGATVPYEFNFHRAVSSDGSRIFWTDLNSGNLYVREASGTDAARTVQADAAVGGGGTFRTASTSGSVVFFTKAGDLYAFDTADEQTVDLAAGGKVLGVIDASEDGSYLYFVAEAALAGGATAGQPNLYLVRLQGASWDSPTLVATLSPGDVGEHDSLPRGVWVGGIGQKTAEITPDGLSLVFQSRRRLSGYDNKGAPEVYVYDSASNQLACASCNPTGEAPAGDELLPLSENDDYQLRWISSDGSRVFFNGRAALVPNDVNGRQDVYEWERYGAAGCALARGCVSLLSGGTSTSGSYLTDTSVNGDDVFIVTRAQLVPADQDENLNLYDVRVGGVRPVSAPACSGSGCQGVPPAPPIFATPSSVTFNGVGNFLASAKTQVKPRSKTVSRAQRLAGALRMCAKKPKRERVSCDKQAHRRYGPLRKAKQTKTENKGTKRHV